MKITINIDPEHPDAALSLQWQMPGADGPSNLYLLPGELTPTQYPHAVKDLSRVAVFYGDHFVLFYAPDNGRCVDGVYTSRADDIYCNTFKLLEVVRKLHAKRIPETVLDTDRFHSVHTESLLTVAQLSAHPNLRNRDELGATLKYSWGGTFFFVRFRKHFFAVTAQHCLRGRDYKTVRLLRPLATKEKAFVPFERITIIEDPEGSLCDWADLAFITLNEDSLTMTDKAASWFLDFDALSKLKTTFTKGDGLGLKGYPQYAGGIDYDTAIMQSSAVALSGTYSELGYEANIHKLHFSRLDGVPDLNGFSGAPVLKIFQREGITAYCFGGVILRGTVQSRTAFFVDYSIVFRALEEILRREN